jgi:hypothetical protein
MGIHIERGKTMKMFIILFSIVTAWSDTVDHEIIKDLDFYQQLDIVKEDSQFPLELLTQILSTENTNKDDPKNKDALELKK